MEERIPLAEQVRFCEARWFRETREQAIAGDQPSMLLLAEMLAEGYGCLQSPRTRLQQEVYFLRLYFLQRCGTASLAQLEALVSSSEQTEGSLLRALELYREARRRLAHHDEATPLDQKRRPAQAHAALKPLEP